MAYYIFKRECELLVPHSIQTYTFNSQNPGDFLSSCSLRICLLILRGLPSAGGASPAEARSRVPQRAVSVLGRGTAIVCAEGGRGDSAAPAEPRSLPRQSPAAPREAQRRPRTRSSAPSCPAGAVRSGVSRPRAPPRGHGPSYTRAAKLSRASPATGAPEKLGVHRRRGLPPPRPPRVYATGEEEGESEGDAWGRCPFLPP